MKKIVVDFPRGSDLPTRSELSWARGVYTINIDEKNVTSWMKEREGYLTSYIWLGTNPTDTDDFQKWHINRFPYDDNGGNLTQRDRIKVPVRALNIWDFTYLVVGD